MNNFKSVFLGLIIICLDLSLNEVLLRVVLKQLTQLVPVEASTYLCSLFQLHFGSLDLMKGLFRGNSISILEQLTNLSGSSKISFLVD
jgi:uncharacterized membrane protein YGL010W